MFVRFMLILGVSLAFASCHVKAATSSVYSCIPVSSEDQVDKEVEPASTATKTNADGCNSLVEVHKISPTVEEEFEETLTHVKYELQQPSCYHLEDRVSDALLLARLSIAYMTSAHPNDSTVNMRIRQATDILKQQPNLTGIKISLELIALYKSIDTENPRTIVQANMRLMAIESFNDVAESIRLVKEALMREALVYTYRFPKDSNPELDGVIGAFPYDRVKDRFAFAKQIVECFEEHDSRVVPVSFLTEVRLDPEQQKELLAYMLVPPADITNEDYADTLEHRTESYVGAGYEVTQVNAVVVDLFIEGDLFAEALAFANKHFDETHASHVEDRLMKLMRERGCYSIMEDADGHKTRMFDFKRGCDSSSIEEEDAESVE